MPTTPPLTRRNFIKSGAVVAGVATLNAQQHARAQGANDHLNIGMIGCGGIAGRHLEALLSMAEEENIAIRWVCDIYKTRAENFQQQIAGAGGEAKVTTNYRDVLDDRDVDYVVIATPEHSHYNIAMDALRENKHVYCEKPMCYDIKEAKKLVKKVNESNLKLQVGVQGMADDSYSSAFKAIKAGKIGLVVEAQIDYVRNHPLDRGPWRKSGITDDTPKPGDLNWNAWLNPRKSRAWNPHHYYEWRCYGDYSGGIATDLFVHRVTRLIRACGLKFPSRVASMGGIYTWDDGRDLPDSLEVLYEYPPMEGITNGMTVHLLGTMNNKRANQHCIRGQEATIVFTNAGFDIISEADNKVIESHKKTGGENIVLHHKNHHAAMRDKKVALNCPAELGLYGVVAARMANLSYFKHKMLEWDIKREYVKFT